MTQKIKHKVRERCSSFYQDELEGRLGDAIEVINRLISRYGEDAYFLSERRPWSEEEALYLFIDRDETPEERRQRETKEQEQESRRIERERQEFERLKQKFGEN